MKILIPGILCLLIILLVTCKPEKEEPVPTSVPVVITGELINISASSATASGQVISDGNLEVTERGIVLGPSVNPTIGEIKIISGSGVGNFSLDINNLTRGTTYHVRAYATNSKGTSYGVDKSLTTQSTLATVTTADLSGITYYGANGGGTISDDGGSAILARGICWSKNQNPTIADHATTDETGIGTFTSTILNLNSSTTYYVRAYATNAIGTAYGNQVEFSTLINPNPNLNPLLSYGTVTDIDGNVYATIAIGSQTWMAENLKVNHYNNGDLIPWGTDGSAVAYGTYTYFDNDSTYNSFYGKLYNWFATTDEKRLCPAGWHLPSIGEFSDLANYTGSSMDAGGNLKEAGNAHWLSPNYGATNSSGFTGLPGGARYGTSVFYYLSSQGYWWTLTESVLNNEVVGIAFGLHHDAATTFNYYANKQSAFSVRCIKD